jgi:serine/threonine-protein kinase
VESTQLLGGRYRLVERLGEGGTAVVWRAYDEVLGRGVAIKLLSPELASDTHFRARIRAEARAAARLNHPHITNVHDYGESATGDGERVPYVVMELLTGPTLTERMQSGPLPVETVLRIATQVAQAPAAAHARGLVHCDVKPGNVVVTRDGAKVVDLGLSAVAGHQDPHGAEGQIWGTPAYIAPERLVGRGAVAATDVYSLGLLLYQALSGASPWRARDRDADAHRPRQRGTGAAAADRRPPAAGGHAVRQLPGQRSASPPHGRGDGPGAPRGTGRARCRRPA